MIYRYCPCKNNGAECHIKRAEQKKKDNKSENKRTVSATLAFLKSIYKLPFGPRVISFTSPNDCTHGN